MANQLKTSARTAIQATTSLKLAIKKALDRHSIQLTIEKYSPRLSLIPENSVPAVEIMPAAGVDGANTFVYEKGAPNLSVTLLVGFEHLSYHLGKRKGEKNAVIRHMGEKYMLDEIENTLSGRMAINAREGLSRHALPAVGLVKGNDAGTYIIFQLDGKTFGDEGEDGNAATEYERRKFASAVVERLAELHTQGFACGGLKPEEMAMEGGKAKVRNATRIVAMDESDSLFYEAAATLYFLKAAGFATSKDLLALARKYLSHSPVCRGEAAVHARKKKLSGALYLELAAAAEKFKLYFPRHQQAKKAA